MNITYKLDNTQLALGRSAFYEALSIGFRFPSQEIFGRILNEEQNQALSDIAAMLDKESGDGDASLRRQTLELLQGGDIGSIATLETSYRLLFGHTAHAKVPPYETEYGGETLFQQPQQLGDLSGFYTAFGLRLNVTEHERVDHISCECEFLSFLTRKEAYALEQGSDDMLEETRKAQKFFLRDHLARFTPAFSNLLIREHPRSFYSALGRLGHEFVLTECGRHGVAAGPEQLRLRPKLAVDDCFSCGSGEEVMRDMCGSECES